MKRILIIAICLFGLGLPFASSVSNPQIGKSLFPSTSTSTQKDSWEYIGTVKLHALYSDGTAFQSGTASLYAKAIGSKIIYQTRSTNVQTKKDNTFSVATGYWEFYCKDCKIWHSFDGKAGDYYINLP